MQWKTARSGCLKQRLLITEALHSPDVHEGLDIAKTSSCAPGESDTPTGSVHVCGFRMFRMGRVGTVNVVAQKHSETTINK